MISQGYRPAGDPNFTPATKYKMGKCLDCRADIQLRGCKKRCTSCSDIHRSNEIRKAAKAKRLAAKIQIPAEA